MTVPAHVQKPLSSIDDGESALHFFVREGQVLLRWTTLFLLVLTIGTMVTFFFWAILPATLTLIAYLALLLINMVERRSAGTSGVGDDRAASAAGASIAPRPHTADAEEVREDVHEDANEEPENDFAMPLFKHESKVFLIAVIALVAIAGIIAAFMFGGTRMLLAIPFLFAVLLLLGGPVWLAAIHDDIETEAGKLDGRGGD